MIKNFSLVALVLLLSFGLFSPNVSQAAPQVDEPTRVIKGPPAGSSYVATMSGHSFTYWASGTAIAYAISANPATFAVAEFLGVVKGWAMSGYEPTPYARIYVSSRQSTAYRLITTWTYHWYEDSKFRTYKTTTTRPEIDQLF
jgi:hypothetical protein